MKLYQGLLIIISNLCVGNSVPVIGKKVGFYLKNLKKTEKNSKKKNG